MSGGARAHSHLAGQHQPEPSHVSLAPLGFLIARPSDRPRTRLVGRVGRLGRRDQGHGAGWMSTPYDANFVAIAAGETR